MKAEKPDEQNVTETENIEKQIEEIKTDSEGQRSERAPMIMQLDAETKDKD